MKKNHSLLGILFCLITIGIFAQNNSANTTENSTVDQQYADLLKKGGNYTANGIRFEVIKITDLTKFKNNIFDSLEIAKKTLAELQSTLAENTTEIDALKSKLSETTTTLNTLTEEKDSMSFFGALVSKTTYRGIVWGIITVLIFGLLLMVYKFRKSNFLTVQAKSALTDLEDEYEQHRRRALEREQKISRELHDERNKNKKGAS